MRPRPERVPRVRRRAVPRLPVPPRRIRQIHTNNDPRSTLPPLPHHQMAPAPSPALRRWRSSADRGFPGERSPPSGRAPRAACARWTRPPSTTPLDCAHVGTRIRAARVQCQQCPRPQPRHPPPPARCPRPPRVFPRARRPTSSRESRRRTSRNTPRTTPNSRVGRRARCPSSRGSVPVQGETPGGCSPRHPRANHGRFHRRS